jgi:hypothetical protein
MDLFAISNIAIFSLPTETSVLMAIRRQLWVVIECSDVFIADCPELEITKLAAPDLIHCRRIDRQPLTYLSALPRQLLKNPALSQLLGNHLLAQLAVVSHHEPSTQWRGAINDQGYLYLQPMEGAIAIWLNHILSLRNLEVNEYQNPPLTASSITLQYIYTRCTQLRHSANQSEITTTELAATTTSEVELIGSILDVWDVIDLDPIKLADNNRRIISFSQRLVENFLEFEKDCCIAAKESQSSVNFKYCLIELVQITAKIILQKYWGLNPLGSW